MQKCSVCGRDNAEHNIYGTEKYVCDNCKGSFFICPGCGNIYKTDDYENGDNGTGFCRKNCSDK